VAPLPADPASADASSPDDLLVTVERGRVLDVKISDFGSALNLEATRTQVFRVGSLTYMSPEQLDGADLDARADQYSLAAVKRVRREIFLGF
jgi:serine/threonine protein kinase